MEQTAERFFSKNVTARERCAFEAGIALGAVAHQFTGIPIIGNLRNLRRLERVIEDAIKLQPYKVDAKVRIRMRGLSARKRHQFDYRILGPDMMDVEVYVKYGKARVKACMKAIKSLGNYPLMYISEIV
ncbi:MAG: dihydroneopterin aldolase family protein [Nitrososphaerota archaeon]